MYNSPNLDPFTDKRLGANFNDSTRKSLIFVINKLTGCPPVDIVPVHKSPWVVVEMEKKDGKKDLLKQKVSKRSRKQAKN